ncbi:hypothetical protein ACWCOP_08010 [Maricaulaceae bacterium MS644]
MRRPLRRLHLIWWAILAPVIGLAASYGIGAAIDEPNALTPAPAELFETAGES